MVHEASCNKTLFWRTRKAVFHWFIFGGNQCHISFNDWHQNAGFKTKQKCTTRKFGRSDKSVQTSKEHSLAFNQEKKKAPDILEHI